MPSNARSISSRALELSPRPSSDGRCVKAPPIWSMKQLAQGTTAITRNTAIRDKSCSGDLRCKDLLRPAYYTPSETFD